MGILMIALNLFSFVGQPIILGAGKYFHAITCAGIECLLQKLPETSKNCLHLIYTNK